MKPPAQNVIHEWALDYLTHRPASVAQLKKVLERRIATWAKRVAKAESPEPAELEEAVEQAKASAGNVLERLQSSGLLDDDVYAKHRAERLTREGKSRRAVAFDLKQKGISERISKEAVPTDGDTELAAAASLLRKKRFGPFTRKDDVDDKERNRWLGALARAGFSFSTANRALRLDRESAEELIRNLP